MILPAWIADVDAGAGQQALEVIGTKLECPRAAQCFYCNNAPFVQNLRVFAKQKCLDRLVVESKAINRLVATCRLTFQTRFFCNFDRIKQRYFSVIVKINAHAKIDLGCAGISVKRFVQPENRVARSHFYGRKDGLGHWQIT